MVARFKLQDGQVAAPAMQPLQRAEPAAPAPVPQPIQVKPSAKLPPAEPVLHASPAASAGNGEWKEF